MSETHKIKIFSNWFTVRGIPQQQPCRTKSCASKFPEIKWEFLSQSISYGFGSIRSAVKANCEKSIER